MYHLKSEAIIKKNLKKGIMKPSGPNWTEDYVRRSVKKKKMKAMFCEVCCVRIPNYLEVCVGFSAYP